MEKVASLIEELISVLSEENKEYSDLVILSHEKTKVIVNNDIAAKDTPVYPNFNVKYQDMSEMSYDELEAGDSVKETDVDDIPENVSHSTISVKVNNTYVTLTGKESYTFVDILDVYPFDMSKMGGDELVMTIDKVKAEFVSPLHNGAEVELYWK